MIGMDFVYPSNGPVVSFGSIAYRLREGLRIYTTARCKAKSSRSYFYFLSSCFFILSLFLDRSSQLRQRLFRFKCPR